MLRPHRSIGKRSSCRVLRFESLETRELMAASSLDSLRATMMPAPAQFASELRSASLLAVAPAASAAANSVAVAETIDWGLAIQRGNGRYDLQPTVLFDSTDLLDANRNGVPDRQYKMWWLGRYQPGDADKQPDNLDAGDRIYYATSEDGKTWSKPRVVLKGSAGTRGAITADDHLLGSPSVLKVNGKYHMFYEAYSMWAVPLNRFYSFQRGDNWTTNESDMPSRNNAEGYAFERNLGFAPLLVKAGAHPVYSGEVVYGGGKFNRYLTTSVPFVGSRDGSRWTARNEGSPVFWLYDQPGSGRKAIYSFFDPIHRNTYATDDPRGDGVKNALLVEVLGYAAASLDGPDMVGSLQNRIMLATSTDGVNWTRFRGPARGGAIIAPQNELTSVYDPQTWTIQRSYGSGYPSALVRDGVLELYFTDDGQNFRFEPRRVRLALSQIENPSAWRAARAPGTPELTQWAGYGGDIKWSPTYRRYFSTSIRIETPGITNSSDPRYRQSATLRWTSGNPDPSRQSAFSDTQAAVLPAGNRVGGWGGIVADGLGQVVVRPGTSPDAGIHVYFDSYRYGENPVFDSDFSQAAVRLLSIPPGMGAIHGQVFADANGSKKPDAGEQGLSGWTVFIDANHNGRLDAGELQTTTDAWGRYQFFLAPGQYRIRVVARPGFATPYSRVVTVTAKQGTQLDFGVLRK